MKNLYLIDAPLDAPFPLNKKDSPTTNTIPTQSPLPNTTTPVTQDPLIASDWQKLAPILVLLIVIGIIIALGYFNKRLEHAIAFSFVLSAIAFIFFFPH